MQVQQRQHVGHLRGVNVGPARCAHSRHPAGDVIHRSFFTVPEPKTVTLIIPRDVRQRLAVAAVVTIVRAQVLDIHGTLE